MLLPAAPVLAGDFHETLTDTSTNTWVEDFAIDSGVGKNGQVAWSVRKYTLRGGKQAGNPAPLLPGRRALQGWALKTRQTRRRR